MRWSSLPDELLQCIAQSLLELSPASLATFSRLERRSHALTRQRLANMERLRLPPFRLSGQEILGGLWSLDLEGNQIGDAGLTALAKAVESGALNQLQVCWRPSAL